MLGTVLNVLGIIGTVLLVILAIVLVLIVFVLFAPLRYKFVLKYNAYADTSNVCFIKLSWLCHIIKFRADISTDGMKYVFRLFGFKSKLLDKYLNNDNVDDDYDELDESLVSLDNKKSEETIDIVDSRIDESMEDITKEKNEQGTLDNTGDYSDNTQDDNKLDLLDEIEQIWEDIVSETEYEDVILDEDIKPHRKKGFIKRLFSFNPIKACSDLFKKTINTIQGIVKGIVRTVKTLIKKYELAMDILEKKSTNVAIDRIKLYLSKLCAHIKPRKAKLRLNIGFDDPSRTGQILAVIGTMYGFIGPFIEVNPNFEDEELDIDCSIKGRLRVFNLAIIGFKIMKDKAIKRLKMNISKLKED